MNVLQLTFHCAANYGAILQAYALGVIIEKMGHKVKLLNLRPTWMAPVWPGRSPTSWILRGKFSWFRKQYLPPMTPPVRDSSSLSEQCKGIDAVVVGSDQVWNPEITRHFSKEYFLDFVPDKVRRISYAPSFGLEPSEWHIKMNDGGYGPLLKRFHAISVREISGLEIVQSLIPEVNAHFVLDPTLLLKGETYKNRLNFKYQKHGVVSFKFYNSPAYNCLLKKMESIVGEKVVILNRIKDDNFSTIIAPSIQKWITTIAGSSFVVTDSFHATCFAILFNKPFVVLPANPKRVGRISSLLEYLGLSGRLFFSEDELLSNLSSLRPVNYDRVNGRLDELRRSSLNFLDQSLTP